MAMGPGDFLSNFEAEIMEEFFYPVLEAQVTEHWESTREAHASIAGRIGKKDLPGLMTYDKEDPHGILPLAPDPLEPCAEVIRGFGEAAVACAAEFEGFVKKVQEDLGALQKSCNEDTYEGVQSLLQVTYENEKAAVDNTKMSLLALEGKSYSAALRLQKKSEEVDAMDDEEKALCFEEMQNQLRSDHIQCAKDGVGRLLAAGKLPALHQDVHARHQQREALQGQADAAAAKLDAAETMYGGLEQQNAKMLEKKQKCARICRVTYKEVEAASKTLKEAEKARQKAWKEYQDAYLRNEAAKIVEDSLAEAKEAISQELDAAGAALAETRTQCQQCKSEAAKYTETVSANIQASHAGLLEFSKPAVEEAWKNAAFASELCKCVVADKRQECNHLLEEQRQSQKQAAKQKRRNLKAKTLEKVEQLGRQLAEVQADLATFEDLGHQAEDQFNSFRLLQSGLDEEAITHAAQDAASACYGNFQLYVSEDDGSDDSTEASGPTMALQQHMANPIEKMMAKLQEQHKKEMAQMKFEWQAKMLEREKAFELEKQDLVQMMREEVRAELRREDTSSLHSFERLSDIGE